MQPTEAASQAGSWLFSGISFRGLLIPPRREKPPDTNGSKRQFTASPAFRLPPPGAPVPRGGLPGEASASSRVRTIHRPHSQPGVGLGWRQGWESLRFPRSFRPARDSQGDRVRASSQGPRLQHPRHGLWLRARRPEAAVGRGCPRHWLPSTPSAHLH